MSKKPKKDTKRDVLQEIIDLTGLPAEIVRGELQSILERKQIDADNLTLEEMRSVVASYLRETMRALLEQDKPKNVE